MTFDEFVHTNHLKLREVADQLAVSEATISRLRSEISKPSLDLAKRIYAWSEGHVNYLTDEISIDETSGGEA